MPGNVSCAMDAPRYKRLLHSIGRELKVLFRRSPEKTQRRPPVQQPQVSTSNSDAMASRTASFTGRNSLQAERIAAKVIIRQRESLEGQHEALESSTPNTQAAFPFFSLAPEMRCEVYHHALVAPAGATKIHLPATELQVPGPHEKAIEDLFKDFMALCLVSKDMHAEARVHFLKHNHLQWHGNLATREWDAFQQHALPHVRALSFSVSDYQICFMGQAELFGILTDMRRCSLTHAAASEDNKAGDSLTHAAASENNNAEDYHPWSLRTLGLVVRNDYLDVDRDHQVWFHWKTAKEAAEAAPPCKARLPPIRGLKRLEVVAPWEIEDDWKAMFEGGLEEGCELVFGNNYDETVLRPREGPWEQR